MKEKIFFIDFLLFYIGGGAQLFEKTMHGKLITVKESWLYVLGTKKEDLNALLNEVEWQKEHYSNWGQTSIAIEAIDIEECLDIFLSYVRCGYNYQKINTGAIYSTFINKKLKGLKPHLNINFNDWPIKINRVTTFPSCGYLNEDWIKKGVMVCGDKLLYSKPTELDLCPICCGGIGIDDGACLPSARITTNRTKSIEQKVKYNNQEFILREISWRK